MAKSLLIISRQAPWNGPSAREALDIALAGGAFDLPLGMLFLDDGVFQLAPAQQPTAVQQKNLAANLQALPMFGVEELFACSHSLNRPFRPGGNALMTTLHVIAHSPFGDERLASCLRLLGTDDALLLCGDAVYALRSGSEPHRQLQAAGLARRLFALDEDVQARAVGNDLAKAVDYAGFVELSLLYDKVNSWL
jgi:tRNA 2-thiouridine synthesizing protein B